MFRFCDFTYSGLIDILVQALVAILWDFFNTLTTFLPIVRVWIGSMVGIYMFKFKFSFFSNLFCPLGVLLKIGSFWVGKMKVVGIVWECFGDVGASKSTKNNYINITIYLKCVFIKISIFTVFYCIYVITASRGAKPARRPRARVILLSS